jgi:hypothetical protein
VKSLALILAGCSAFAQERVNPDSQTLQEFSRRIEVYVNLQKSLAKDLPSVKPTADPEAILGHQHALAAKLRDARRQERQGAIFTPAIAKEFHRLLALAKNGNDGEHIQKSLERAEPVHLTLHVNDTYPADVPLQSTPPTVLLNLPRLPEELEYRFAGRALALRDAVANIIVDLIPNAIP